MRTTSGTLPPPPPACVQRETHRSTSASASTSASTASTHDPLAPLEVLNAQVTRLDTSNSTGRASRQAKAFLAEEGLGEVHVIAKIENLSGLRNLDDILTVADGIILARGSLGTVVSSDRMFRVQKYVLTKCNIQAKVRLPVGHRLGGGSGIPAAEHSRAQQSVVNPQAARGWPHPPCTHSNNQSCYSLTSAFEMAAWKTLN
jgi:hypothetical protein